MSTCINGNECSLPTGENDLKVLVCQLQREVETLINKTEAKLLLQDGKIAECCTYLKDNLSNSIRCLLQDMKNSGELDELITETILCSLNKRVIFIDKATKIKDSILQLGDVIQTLGYHEVNDGGKALYKIREMKLEDVEDKGLIHSTINGYVAELIVDNKINVKQFGAKGDGITDDSDSIQKAFNVGINVEFNEGTYLLNKEVEITKSIEIVGNNTIIKGCGFKSTSKNIDIIVKGITFEDILKSALVVTSANLNVDNCNFKNIGISENLDETHEGSGIYIQDDFNLTVKNSKFNLCYGHGAIFTIHNGNVLISNNKFDDNIFRAIHIFSYEKGCVVSGSIEHNIINDCGKSNKTGSAIGCNGIYSTCGSQIECSNNKIINSRENAIEGRFKVISGNYIDGTNVEIDTKSTPSVEGIFLGWCDVIVTNNYLKNVKRRGITLVNDKEDNHKIIIKNNIIEEIEEYKDENFAILLIGNKLNNKSIINNVVSNKINFNKLGDNNLYVGDLKDLGDTLPTFSKIVTPNIKSSLAHSFTSIEPFTYSNCTPTIVKSDLLNKKVIHIDYEEYSKLLIPDVLYGEKIHFSMKMYARGKFDINLLNNNEYVSTLSSNDDTFSFKEIDVKTLINKTLKDDMRIHIVPKKDSFVEIANVIINCNCI